MDLFSCTRDASTSQPFSKNEKIAFDRGYRVKAGEVYSPTGKKMSTRPNTTGYLRFNIVVGSRTDGTRKSACVAVHRLVAYQKYGDSLYKFQCVRHKDGDQLNNLPENVEPGTHKRNSQDIPKRVREKCAKNAAAKNRRFTNEEVKEIREQHTSYKKTMKKYGITSKGTLWHILNNNYVTEKAG